MSEDALKIAEIASEIWRLKYLKAKDELAKAVLEEREACVQIIYAHAKDACDVYGERHLLMAANAIRARGGKDE